MQGQRELLVPLDLVVRLVLQVQARLVQQVRAVRQDLLVLRGLELLGQRDLADPLAPLEQAQRGLVERQVLVDLQAHQVQQGRLGLQGVQVQLAHLVRQAHRVHQDLREQQELQVQRGQQDQAV